MPFPGSGGTTHKSQKEKLRQKKEALSPEEEKEVFGFESPLLGHIFLSGRKSVREEGSRERKDRPAKSLRGLLRAGEPVGRRRQAPEG